MKQPDLLRIGSVVFAILLFAVSHRLWWQAGNLFPQVPLLGLVNSWDSSVCAYLDRFTLILTMFSLVLQLSPIAKLQSIGTIGFLLGACLLVVTDQHRLQPWLQQLFLLTAFSWLLSRFGYVSYARFLLISIYLFSAFSKLDYTFLQTLGQEFAAQLFRFVGQRFDQLSDATRLGIAFVFPVSELAIGMGLAWSKSRRFAAYVAIVLHLVLLLILGPWGLRHHWGVLVWNFFFIFQIGVLFLWREQPTERPTEQLATAKPTSRWGQRVCWALILLPLLEPFQCMDHWPAWQLYAPRNSRVVFSVLEGRVSSLPNSLQRFVDGDPEAATLWRRFDIDAWSLESIGVPIYPQDRFQLGVSLAIADRFDLGGGVRAEVRSTADRLNGMRTQSVFRGAEEIAEATRNQFRLNAMPRRQNSR